MLKTIKLYGVLGQKFGREFKLDVANTREAMRALSVQIAGFEHFMLHAHEQGLRFAVFLKSKNSSNKRGKKRPAIYDHETKRLITGDNIGEEQLDMNTEADTIHIVPRVMGAGGNNGILQLVLGAILIAASFIPGIGQAAQVALIGAGAGMAMGGLHQCSCQKLIILKIKTKTAIEQIRALAVQLPPLHKVILFQFFMVNGKSAASL